MSCSDCSFVTFRAFFLPLTLTAAFACSSDEGENNSSVDSVTADPSAPGYGTVPPTSGTDVVSNPTTTVPESSTGGTIPGSEPSGPATPTTSSSVPDSNSLPPVNTDPVTPPGAPTQGLPPDPSTPPTPTNVLPDTPIDPGMMGSGGTSPVNPPIGAGAMPPDMGSGAMPPDMGSGATGSDPGMTPMPSPDDVLFSDDFESGAAGQVPDGWDTFLAYQVNNPNPQAGNTAALSSERAKSGSQSVHFQGGGQMAQITRALPTATSKVYFTAWVYMTRQLGENPGDNHEHIFALRGEPGTANNEVRFGEIKGVIGTNEVPTDNISPLMDRWGMGPALPANTWICFEVGFIGDQPQHELHAWADGELVHSITAPDQWQNGAMPANWLDGKFTEAVFGWHSFSGHDIDVWMDDIIVSTSRQACPE
jgi:hypothetical protein